MADGPQGPSDAPVPFEDARHGNYRSERRLDTRGPDRSPGGPVPVDRRSPAHPHDPEAAEERRLAALYGIGDPPPPDGGRNPFWWVWAFVVPFMLAAMGLMIWRISTAPERVLPGL